MSDRFQILSLDGGGIKGLFSAAILSKFEDDHNVNIINHFDLIAGTSTGGIIAIALGLGKSPSEILKFYVEDGPKIFNHNKLRTIRHCFRTKYSSRLIEESLKKHFEDKKIGDSKSRLVIPSYNMGEDNVYIFKTPHHPRLQRDYKLPAWQVALATSSAPTYFPSFRKVDNIRLIDGGVWATNPIMVAIIEATSMCEASLSSIRVLSIGTTDEVKNRHGKLDYGGRLQWLSEASDVIMKGQSISAHNQASHLLGNKNILRINPKVPDGLFDLDKTSEENLISKAADKSRCDSPYFKEMFLDHCAKDFKPYHKL